MSNSTKALPKSGRSAQQILDTMKQLQTGDAKWKEGRTWSLVYYPGEEHYKFVQEAFTTFFSENGLNPAAFPSLRQMETEVVAMTASLLGGGDEAVGNMTSGGTESILMAMKTAKEWAKKNKPRVKKPQVILPTSIHPAFEKAANYFDIEIVHIPVGPDYRADVKATKRAINRNTIMIVGSACAYPQGVVDPIEELGKLAKKNKILCHVDACVGGFMLPFVKKLGYALPGYDLSVDGVTSLSVDVHKYGYAAKGASVILYKNAELRRHQYFAYTDWTGGIYVSPSMAGTRPGGAIAAAWAILNRLGEEGYMEIAQRVMKTTEELKKGIHQIPDLHILGQPHMSILSFASTERDIYQIADELTLRGWHFDRQQNPNSIHLTVSQGNTQSAQEFLKDLREAVEVTPVVSSDEKLKAKLTSVALGSAVKILPSSVISKITAVAADKMGMDLSDGDLPERSAAMYGMMATLPNRGDVEELVIDALDGMTRYQSSSEIQFVEAPKPKTTAKTTSAKSKTTAAKSTPRKPRTRTAKSTSKPKTTAQTTTKSATTPKTTAVKAATKTASKTTTKPKTTRAKSTTAAKSSAKAPAKTTPKPSTRAKTATKTTAKPKPAAKTASTAKTTPKPKPAAKSTTTSTRAKTAAKPKPAAKRVTKAASAATKTAAKPKPAAKRTASKTTPKTTAAKKTTRKPASKPAATASPTKEASNP